MERPKSISWSLHPIHQIDPGLLSDSEHKKLFDGKKLPTGNNMEYAVDGYFEEFDGFFNKQAIEAIEYSWEKRIDLNEDYVLKTNVKNLLSS